MKKTNAEVNTGILRKRLCPARLIVDVAHGHGPPVINIFKNVHHLVHHVADGLDSLLGWLVLDRVLLRPSDRINRLADKLRQPIEYVAEDVGGNRGSDKTGQRLPTVAGRVAGSATANAPPLVVRVILESGNLADRVECEFEEPGAAEARK